jgi:hypothetical protein
MATVSYPLQPAAAAHQVTRAVIGVVCLTSSVCRGRLKRSRGSPRKRRLALQTLVLSNIARITHVSALAALKQLRILDLSECTRINNIHALFAMTQLHSLDP